MAIPDLPILSMLHTRMQWHQERQRVLAVANAVARCCAAGGGDARPARAFRWRRSAIDLRKSITTRRRQGSPPGELAVDSALAIFSEMMRMRIVTFRDEIDREIDAHRGQARPYSDRYVGLPRAARTGQPHGRRQG